VLIHNKSDTVVANINMKNCFEIRVLDENKSVLKLCTIILEVGVF